MGFINIAGAAGEGGGDLVVGLLVGLGIGLIVGPAVRSWLIIREWAETSRQARLADQILSRMRIDAQGDGKVSDADPGDEPASGSWRALP
jgi:hypothetical protein